MIIKTATFNLFQFCSPEFSFYTKKEKFKKDDWEEKKNWIKKVTLIKKLTLMINSLIEGNDHKSSHP